MNHKLHTPYGVKDFLPHQCHQKSEIERRIMAVFASYGFASVQTPTFEFIEVFEGKGTVTPKEMYKFIDRDGRTLALRPDMTPALARIAATNFGVAQLPLRLSTTGSVFRYNESYQGKYREFTQAGVELMGGNVAEANGEVIAVAINSLLAAGVKDFHIDIGHVQFLKAVFEETGLDQETQQAMQTAVIEKNFVALQELVKDTPMATGIKTILNNLSTFIGLPTVLATARTHVANPTALAALDSLQGIYDTLVCYGLESYIRFDLSTFGHLDYYTDIIFSGYTSGTGFSILTGGRYDNLISQFGANMPSVGFSIKILELLTALESQQLVLPAQTIDTLVVFSEEGRKTALTTSDALRRSGLLVENSLLGNHLAQNIAYATQKGIGGILHFIDAENITLHNLIEGTQTTVTVADLLQGGTQ